MKKSLFFLVPALLLYLGDAFAQPATNSFQIWGTDYNYLYSIDGPDPTTLYDQVLINSPTGFSPGRKLTMVDGKIYGVTMASKTPDTPGFGQIFEAGYQTGYRFVYTFPSPDGVQAPDGKTPQTLTLANGKLYGVTSEGGANSKGVLFEFDPNTLVYTKKFDFDSLSGYAPGAGLTLAANGKLYGLTTRGGIYGYGTLYEFDPATGNYSRKVDFDGTTNGWRPDNEMTLAANNKLYGWHNLDYGVIFEYDPATNTYAIKYRLNWSTDGIGFYGPLMHASNGKIYGGTYYSPDYYAGPAGVLFEYDYVANIYTVKHDFDAVWNDGKIPFGMVEAPNGKLYGNTLTGGPYVNKAGNLFEFDPATGIYTSKINYLRQSSSIPLMVRTQKITIDPVPYKMIWDGPFVINATGGTSGNPVILTSSNPEVISLSGNVATVAGYGITRITATQAGNDKYWPAPEADILIFVLRDQTITFDPLPEKLFGDAPFGIAASVSSNTPGITYTSSNPAVATISGSTVTITGVGTTTITAYHTGNNTHIPVSATQDLIVHKGNQSITFDPLDQKTLGDAPFTLNATASSGLALTYTSSDTDVATVSGNTVTLVGAGTTTITASQEGNVNYNPATDVQQTLTVKLPQAITFVPLIAKTFGDAPFTLTGTASSGLGVSYISSNPDVATVSGNTVTILTAGTTTITASQGGNATYDPAPDVPQILTVNKKDQTITFTTLTSKTFGDTPFVLTATASSGFPVSYTSSNTSVATIAGNTVTIVGAGTTTITASQPGDANHNAAADVQQVLTVNKSNQTITFDILPAKTFGDAPFTLTANASSGFPVNYASSNTSVATISGNIVTIVGAGTTTITALQAGDANYNAADDVQQVLTVNKSNQSITFNILPSKTFGDAPFVLTATASSALPVSYISSNTGVATISGNTVTIVGAGTTTITASQPGNGSYNAATNIDQTLTVNKLDQTITFNALPDKFVTDQPFALSATASSGLPVVFTSSNPSVATVANNIVTIVSAGTTTITASQAGDAGYSAAPDVPRTLTVRKLPQTITFPPIPYKTWGDAPFALTATASSGLPVTFEYDNNNYEWIVASLSGNIVSVHESGWAFVTARQEGNDTYEAASVTRDLIVMVLMQEITFDELAYRTFGDAPFVLTATANSGLPVSYTSSNTSVATVSGNVVTIIAPGTTTITALQEDFGLSFDPAIPVERTLTINKANQIITFNPLSDKTLVDVPFDLTATASSALPVSYVSSNTDVATVSGNTVTIVGAGTTTITASQPGNTNYNGAEDISQALTVNKLDQEITFGTLVNKTFGDAAFTINATASSGLPVTYVSGNTGVATISGNTVTIVGAGTTAITALQEGNTIYNAADVTQNLTVNKQDQTIAFGTLADKTIGDPTFTLAATSTSGLPVTFSSSNTSVAMISSGNTVTIVGAGTTTITASQAGNANYQAVDVSRTFTVNKITQTITFPDLPWSAFGDAPFTLAATASSGLTVTYVSSNTNVATIAGNTVTIVGGGTTTITASQAGNVHYQAATDVEQTFTVNLAGQDITFGPLSDKVFEDAPFELTATASSGLPVSYWSNNEEVATVSGNTVTIVGAGTAVITAYQEGNSNYDAANNVEQSLTVSKAVQHITFAPIADKTYGDAPFILAATASSALPVSYESSNINVATISGNTITIVGAGTSTITARQSGNANYHEATQLMQAFTVSKASQTITFNELSDKTTDDAVFDLSATASSDLAVTYESSNTGVATISGNTVTIVGEGVTVITASQPGNENYLEASPVSKTLKVKKSQSITFAALAGKVIGDPAFELTAITSSGLPLNYTSSNTSVATVTGNTVTIAGAGTTVITASQPGDAVYVAAASVSQTLTISKKGQVITFAEVPDKMIGDVFDLSATVSSGLSVIYTSTSDKISIDGSSVTLLKPGRASITASRHGDDIHEAATPVTRSFCIKPATPTLSFSSDTGDNILTSSASQGNQWFFNGVPIAGATNATLQVTEPGIYNVQVAVEGCVSDLSGDQTLIVMGAAPDPDGLTIEVFPNPASDWLTVSFGTLQGKKAVTIFQLDGKETAFQEVEGHEAKFRVANYAKGSYIVRVKTGQTLKMLRFMKN